MNVQATRTKLQDLKGGLSDHRHAIFANLSVALETDSDKRATQVDDVLWGMREDAYRFMAIDTGLERLENWPWGRCVECRDSICDDGLTVVLATPRCTSGASFAGSRAGA